MRIIEEAAGLHVGTLISFEPANGFHSAGFTARSLTDDRPIIQPAQEPLPDDLVFPQRPTPASWASPRSRTTEN